jgi:succinylarginine dihydrolase
MNTVEVNFDALVGPTHNYAGLAFGNLAATQHAQTVSNPKAAALEGLAKMKLLMDLGVRQAVLPPQARPDLQALHRLGFSGSDASVLQEARRTNPAHLAACYSASNMWAANAATVSPSADCADGRVHFTTANLISQFHRSLEAPRTSARLRTIFPDPNFFIHHPPLPSSVQFSDEGAANHTRLAPSHGSPGIEWFVYGRSATHDADSLPTVFPTRQTREASAAIARLHQLDAAATCFTRQNPVAIDAGVFHNDVICVGNLNVVLCHELAFVDTPHTLAEIREVFLRHCGGELIAIVATQKQLPLADAVRSYVFNSQLVSLPDGGMSLIAPHECAQCESARRFIDEILAADNPIRSVHHVDIRQSMKNGGGPACLRLRVALNDDQIAAVHPGVFLSSKLHAQLIAWVNRHYRDRLAPDDLADPALLDESRRALDDLGKLLGLGA